MCKNHSVHRITKKIFDFTIKKKKKQNSAWRIQKVEFYRLELAFFFSNSWKIKIYDT